MTTPAEIRAATMADLAQLARDVFAQYPDARSVMVGFAQYWADEADDAVHAHVVASDRELPLWPHPCDADEDSYAEGYERTPGEYCRTCESRFPYLRLDENGSAIAGFEMYCTEDGSQESPASENYTPYAIARKRDDDVEIEHVGIVRRAHQDFAIGRGERAPWPDDRARALFAQICAHPADDGPRHVLADHLLERGDPRGELIALELAGKRDARHAALLAEHLASWLDPIGEVIAMDAARTTRGFVAHVDVFADDDAATRVRGAEAWGTVESLRYLPGSHGVLDPAMVALRSIGTVTAHDIRALVGASRPWAIETLELQLDDMAIAARLCAATTLPALRHLIVSGPSTAGVLAVLGSATWWSQLQKLTVLGEASQEVLDLPPVIAVPAFAFGPADDLDRPAGWHVTHVRDAARVEIAMVGWHRHGTYTELARLVTQARKLAPSVELRASRYFVPTDADRARAGL